MLSEASLPLLGSRSFSERVPCRSSASAATKKKPAPQRLPLAVLSDPVRIAGEVPASFRLFSRRHAIEPPAHILPRSACRQMLLQTHERVLHHILRFVGPQPDANHVAQQRLAKFAVQSGSLARLGGRRASGIAGGIDSPLICFLPLYGSRAFSLPRASRRIRRASMDITTQPKSFPGLSSLRGICCRCAWRGVLPSVVCRSPLRPGQRDLPAPEPPTARLAFVAAHFSAPSLAFVFTLSSRASETVFFATRDLSACVRKKTTLDKNVDRSLLAVENRKQIVI